MSISISVGTAFEIEAFHVPPGAVGRTLSVTLGLMPETGAGSEAVFAAFLKALPGARFYAYRLVEVAGGQFELHLVDGPLTEIGGPAPGLSARLLPWLEKRSRGRWDAEFSQPGNDVVELSAIGAPHLLAAASTWDAPLPQQAGLVRLVRGPTDTNALVIVPWFDAANAPADVLVPRDINPDGQGTALALDLPDPQINGLAGLMLQLATLLAPKADPTSLVDEATGFIRLGDSNVAAALKRLRAAGPTQLWAFTEVLGLDRVLEGMTQEPGAALDRARWLAVNGLAVLCDPVLIGLTMAGTRREGPFLAALGAVLESANSGELEAIKLPAGWSFRIAGLSDVLTGRILELASTKGGLARLLAAAFELGPLPEAAALNASETLLQVLLSIHAGKDAAQFDPVAAERRYGVSLERQVLVELGVLAKLAQDESAVEGAAKRILALVRLDGALIALGMQGPDPAHPDEMAEAQKLAEAALAAFWQVIDTGFNGLDAARHAMGALFEAAAIVGAQRAAEAAALGPWTVDGVRASLLGGNWFAKRLGLVTPALDPEGREDFDLLADRLPKAAGGLLDEDRQRILTTLTDRLGMIAAGLFADPDDTRFVPDPVPQDVSVQVAVDASVADGDDFEARFNGVALLVQREGESWRYANLATLTYADRSLAAAETLHPLQPVAVDGARSLTVSYQGVPLASRTFEVAKAEPVAADQAPFYEIDDPEFPHDADRRLWPLSYGTVLNIAAHVVTKSGSLPKAVQSAAAPWLPRPEIVAAEMPAAHVRRVDYRRTTAIGGPALSEVVSSGAAPRIGAGLDDVVPLAADYPRRTLSCTSGETVLDLWRNADGIGTLAIDPATLAARPVALALRDLMRFGGAGKLVVELLAAPDADFDAPALAAHSFDLGTPFAGGGLSLAIGLDGGERIARFGLARGNGAPVEVADVTLAAGDGPAFLRLRLSGTHIALSFAEPDAQSGRKRPANLVLVAPGDGAFRPALGQAVTAVLSYPKVGFLDCDRWLANDTARARAFPDTGGIGSGAARARDLQLLAMTAYLGRREDQSLAALVDAMPDLAVAGLRLTLSPQDGLMDVPAQLVAKLQPKSVDVPIPSLGTWPQVAGLGTGKVADMHKTLRALSMARQAKLSIAAGPLDIRASTEPGGATQIVVGVPAGVVARFGVEMLVPAMCFGEGPGSVSMLDPRLRQLATGRDGDFYLFDGPSLTVEAMQAETVSPADWVGLAAAAIRVVPDGTARSYGLVAAAPAEAVAARRWRALGSIAVATQRWRFTGRPIYSWFDPKNGGLSSLPAVALDGSEAGLGAFEAEAFFERDDADAVTVQKQLDPAPAETRLDTFAWEQPSATLFRHRPTLRSRYRGALRDVGRGTWRGHEAGQWLRVAMLADATRVQLARPQLRALLPLSESPTASGVEAESPPVLAILDERPFAHGGLADRLAAEIRTGFGYGFPAGTPDVPEPPVQIVDAKKEIGPDPRLSYDALPAALATALTVATEGPIGLTFDGATAPAPAFPNSALLLRPRLAARKGAGAGAFEEHFLSVALRRYLDPRWVVDRVARDAAALPVKEPHWVTIDGDFSLAAGTEAVLEVGRAGRNWTAKVQAKALDPVSNGEVTIATASADFAPQLALLHLPLEEGRASLTLFALPEGADAESIATGGGDHPHVLASLDWKVPDGTDVLALTGAVGAVGTAASPVTEMRWTRSGRAFDVLETRGAEAQRARIAVSDLRGLLAGSTLRLVVPPASVALHPMPHLAADPLFVHRHMALLSTLSGGGRGRAMERFGAIRRVMGATAVAAAGAAAVRVVSFEVPARPIGTVGGHNIAVFDLDATRGNVDGPGRSITGLSFSFRLLGDSNRKRQQAELRFDINGVSALVVKNVGATPSNPIAMVHFALTGPKGAPAQLTWRAVLDDVARADGVVANLPLSVPDLLSAETVAVGLGVTPDGECWGDVSMLTLRGSDGLDGFAWDWLFTGKAGLEGGDAVLVTSLRDMPEAEARIISVSPPIPVTAE
jgi:hypothetical protein